MKKVIMLQEVKELLDEEQSFLNRSSVKAMAAGSNKDVLGLHRKEKADLIIASLTADDLSGKELCSIIRNDEALRKVSIMLICPQNDAAIEECVHCGANAFITYPVNTAVLLQEAYHLLQIPPRKTCRIPLKIKLEGTVKNKTFTGTVENISAAGMLFRSPAKIEEGDSILCSFSLEDHPRLSAYADIVRVIEGDGKKGTNLFGVRFSSLSDDTLAIIESYVEKSCAE